MDWLDLQPGQVVADLGAASGHFSRPLARVVGQIGTSLPIIGSCPPIRAQIAPKS